jgi:hemoglobin-like flavoprotein
MLDEDDDSVGCCILLSKANIHTLTYICIAFKHRRPHHWKEARAIFVLAMQKANPYLEEADYDLLQTGTDSCVYKFWNQKIMRPALMAIQELDTIFESEENRALLQKIMQPIQKDKKAAGMLFYKNLMTQHPDVIPFFGTTDMNFLAGHLFDAIELLVEVFNDFGNAIHTLKHLGKIHDNAKVRQIKLGTVCTGLLLLFGGFCFSNDALSPFYYPPPDPCLGLPCHY